MAIPLLAHQHDSVSQAALAFAAAFVHALRVLLPERGLCGPPPRPCGAVARAAGLVAEHAALAWGLCHAAARAAERVRLPPQRRKRRGEDQ